MRISRKILPGIHEKRCAGKEGETITVYGIADDSAYVSAELPNDGVLISDGYAEKYKVKTGDTILLKEAYGNEEYEFTVQGIYQYPGTDGIYAG